MNLNEQIACDGDSPILVGPDGLVIDGHAQMAAARMLEIAEVTVVLLAQRRD
jgi:hypothetical protein